ncbi:MAG TPA: metal ABC transporter ATP-binding protein [Thermoplasmatales archaeon]|nr:MAG: metal ABC transporter ATP-binding protein [Thermoplasmata archaeon]RLF34162.1 MAG: ABC transporter [Thermoplasmata archaeon]RLF59584.1 MAG: ABC transporter [Thermoplasmata archaeon]HDN50344.1 metal ABC transporter ATP-binding protein [Thermoplasmatales archaeon]
MKTPVIEVKDLSVRRGNEMVIKDATFTISRGDYVGIVGPNGGGKTSLLLTLLGIIPLERGTIRLFGKDISSFSQWERIAYVSQDATNFDVNFPLTVRELVSLGRIRRNLIGRKLRKDDWNAVDETLRFMGIENIAHRRIGELSGGQKQRVFVAKALVRNPDIIFLDEPVTGVDAETQEKFYKKLSDLNITRGTTIMIVSHDLAAVFCRMSKVMCVNREVHMADITEELEPDEILKKVYGEHFHFVFHRHQCSGVFEHE